MRAPLALIVLGAIAGPAGAAVLPPPPYAADPQFQADAQRGPAGARQTPLRSSQSNDRYSGETVHPVAAPTPQQYAFAAPPLAAAPHAVRTLAWAGKLEAAPEPAAQPVWEARRPSAAPQPRTIYDPPAAAPPQAAPMRQASAQYPARYPAQAAGGPHFYSLHREYGIQPDPIPIPPRFFGPTADLSAPPPDPVLRRVTDANGQTHTQAVPTDDQGS